MKRILLVVTIVALMLMPVPAAGHNELDVNHEATSVSQNGEADARQPACQVYPAPLCGTIDSISVVDGGSARASVDLHVADHRTGPKFVETTIGGGEYDSSGHRKWNYPAPAEFSSSDIAHAVLLNDCTEVCRESMLTTVQTTLDDGTSDTATYVQHFILLCPTCGGEPAYIIADPGGDDLLDRASMDKWEVRDPSNLNSLSPGGDDEHSVQITLVGGVYTITSLEGHPLFVQRDATLNAWFVHEYKA